MRSSDALSTNKPGMNIPPQSALSVARIGHLAEITPHWFRSFAMGCTRFAGTSDVSSARRLLA